MIIKIDQEKVQVQKNTARIAELQQLLRDTDYVALSDYDKAKPDLLLQRQAWRSEIRQLEAWAKSK